MHCNVPYGHAYRTARWFGTLAVVVILATHSRDYDIGKPPKTERLSFACPQKVIVTYQLHYDVFSTTKCGQYIVIVMSK